jgi:hypothetical protein
MDKLGDTVAHKMDICLLKNVVKGGRFTLWEIPQQISLIFYGWRDHMS